MKKAAVTATATHAAGEVKTVQRLIFINGAESLGTRDW